MKNLRNITLTALLSLLVLASTAQIQPNYFKLTITDGADYDETAIQFSNYATDDYDMYYDATKFFHPNPDVVQLYTTDESDHNYSINAMPELTENKTIDLGYNVGNTKEVKIFLTTENLQTPVIIYLLDKETGKMINMIKEKEYTFTSSTVGKKRRSFCS
jgi:hypothetical protein